MVNLSASPYVAGKQHLQEAMLQHCAQRYGMPLAYVNQIGGNDDLVFDGRRYLFDKRVLPGRRDYLDLAATCF